MRERERDVRVIRILDERHKKLTRESCEQIDKITPMANSVTRVARDKLKLIDLHSRFGRRSVRLTFILQLLTFDISRVARLQQYKIIVSIGVSMLRLLNHSRDDMVHLTEF